MGEGGPKNSRQMGLGQSYAISLCAASESTAEKTQGPEQR